MSHLEPWEKGSRKTSGQVGMCGGVRGVGAGGIVSSAYCLLFKLFTLNLTRRQLQGLIRNRDSPYIRGLGFMYARYCLQPDELWSLYEPYIDDEEELDVKAGGGHTITIGEMLRQFLVKLDWYSTLFPRIPIPIQKKINESLEEHDRQWKEQEMEQEAEYEAEVEPPPVVERSQKHKPVEKPAERSKEKESASYGQLLTKELERHRRPDERERDDDRRHRKSRSRSRSRERSRRDDRRRRDEDRSRRSRRSRSRSRSRHRSRSTGRSRHRRRRSRGSKSRSRSDSRRRGYYDSTQQSSTSDAASQKPDLQGLLPDQFEEDDDFGHAERLLRRAAARKAAMQKNEDDFDVQELGLSIGRPKKSRPGMFI